MQTIVFIHEDMDWPILKDNDIFVDIQPTRMTGQFHQTVENFQVLYSKYILHVVEVGNPVCVVVAVDRLCRNLRRSLARIERLDELDCSDRTWCNIELGRCRQTSSSICLDHCLLGRFKIDRTSCRTNLDPLVNVDRKQVFLFLRQTFNHLCHSQLHYVTLGLGYNHSARLSRRKFSGHFPAVATVTLDGWIRGCTWNWF